MQVIDRKFYSKYHNDTDFSSDLTDFATNLVGSVMEEKKVIATVNLDISLNYEPAQFNTLSINGSSNTMTLGYGSFIDAGFRIGDRIAIQATGQSGSPEVKILAISPTVIHYSIQFGALSNLVENDFKAYLISDLTSFLLNYGVIENSDTTTFISPLDATTTQGFYGSNINHSSSTFVNLTPLGQSTNKSWINGSSKVKFVQRLGVDNEIQQFEVEHTFIIPYYLDGELTNLQTGIAPASLLAANSYKYVADYKFRIGLSDVNSERTVVDDLTLGSVGYFEESYNGFSNNFSVSGLSYTDSALNPVARVVEGNTTKVNFNVNSTISSFSASTKSN